MIEMLALSSLADLDAPLSLPYFASLTFPLLHTGVTETHPFNLETHLVPSKGPTCNNSIKHQPAPD